MCNKLTNTPAWRSPLGVAAAIVAISALGLAAHAADRMVLGEYFTMLS